jgi:hypothetical protein
MVILFAVSSTLGFASSILGLPLETKGEEDDMS